MAPHLKLACRPMVAWLTEAYTPSAVVAQCILEVLGSIRGQPAAAQTLTATVEATISPVFHVKSTPLPLSKRMRGANVPGDERHICGVGQHCQHASVIQVSRYLTLVSPFAYLFSRVHSKVVCSAPTMQPALTDMSPAARARSHTTRSSPRHADNTSICSTPRISCTVQCRSLSRSKCRSLVQQLPVDRSGTSGYDTTTIQSRQCVASFVGSYIPPRRARYHQNTMDLMVQPAVHNHSILFSSSTAPGSEMLRDRTPARF